MMQLRIHRRRLSLGWELEVEDAPETCAWYLDLAALRGSGDPCSMVAQRYDVTPQTAHEALLRLSEAEILVERPLSRRKKGRPRRVFAAAELIDLLSDQ